MGLREALADLLSGYKDETDPETPEPTTANDAEETPGVTDPETPEPTTANDAEEVADTPGDGGVETPAEEPTPTLPEEQTPHTAEERSDMNILAVENEALRRENAMLRTRIAELGGDDSLGIVEEVIDTPAEDVEDEYDPEADVAEQEAELKRLRGE